MGAALTSFSHAFRRVFSSEASNSSVQASCDFQCGQRKVSINIDSVNVAFEIGKGFRKGSERYTAVKHTCLSRCVGGRAGENMRCGDLGDNSKVVAFATHETI